MDHKERQTIAPRHKRAQRSRFLELKESASLRIIKGMEQKNFYSLFEERSQGFCVEDQIRSDLQRITRRERKLKTERIGIKTENPMIINKHKRKTTKKNYQSLISKYNPSRIEDEQKPDSTFLPFLKEFIERKEYLEDLANQQKQLFRNKRRKIIHLIVFSLHRYKMGKYYEALDILLMVSMYFEKRDQEKQLKELCLSFIYKLERSIKRYHKNQGYFKKRKVNLKGKKRKSLTVLKFISQQKFMENFMQNLRKSKLIYQSSFRKFVKGGSETQKINGKCNLKIPSPGQLFSSQDFNQSPPPTNYSYVAIVADDQTNSFPYSYPKSLTDSIPEGEYRQIVCKLNSLLLPESKSYTFQRMLKMYYIPFCLIFFVMMLFTIVTQFIQRQSLIGRIIYLLVFVTILIVLGLTINSQEHGYTNLVEIKMKMQQYLQFFQRKYQAKNIKFKMAEKADAFFIIFLQEEESEEESSSSNSQLTEIVEVENQFTESKAASILNKSIASPLDQSSRIGQNKQNQAEYSEIDTPTNFRRTSAVKNSSFFYAHKKNITYTPKKQRQNSKNGLNIKQNSVSKFQEQYCSSVKMIPSPRQEQNKDYC